MNFVTIFGQTWWQVLRKNGYALTTSYDEAARWMREARQ